MTFLANRIIGGLLCGLVLAPSVFQVVQIVELLPLVSFFLEIGPELFLIWIGTFVAVAVDTAALCHVSACYGS